MSDPTASAVQVDCSDKDGAGKTSLAVLALVGLLFAYNLGLNITPIINGLWTERLGLAPSQAGLVISAQFALMAVSTMLTARLLQKLNVRRAAMISALAVGAAYVATGYAQTPALLALCFGAAGIGIGVQMACVATLLSRHENAERLYAIAVVAASFVIAALTIVFASVAPRLSLQTLFVGLAIIPAAQFLLSFCIPAGPASQAVEKPDAAKAGARDFPLVILSMVFMQVGGMAVWAFTERVGHHLGIPTATIGTILAATAVSAIVGAACAAGLSRLHMRRPLAIIGLLVFGLSNLSIVAAGNMPVYAVALLGQAFALTFTLPFLTAIALEENDGGRTAANGTGLAMLLGAVSPYVAGWIAENHGLQSIVLFSGAALAASVVPLLLRRRSQITTPPVSAPVPDSNV